MESSRLERHVVRKPTDFPARFAYAFALYQEGKLKEAEAQFLAALPLSPEDPHLNMCLGHICLVLGRTDEAINLVEYVLELAPMYAEGYAILGSAKEIKGDLLAAEICWHKAAALDPKLGIPISILPAFTLFARKQTAL